MTPRLRALWRALFKPEPPPRLDGAIIQFRTMAACAAKGEKWTPDEWQRQNELRGEENRRREQAWKRGERV